MFAKTRIGKYEQIAEADDEAHPKPAFIQRWKTGIQVASHVIVSLLALAIGLVTGQHLTSSSSRDGIGMSQC
jgi:hypothetical protein